MPKTTLSSEELRRNFADLHPALSDNEALAEAARCLYCHDAPCMRACPTHIDVPRFIRQILHQDPLDAARTIFSENVFGGSCARVCPTEVLCEGACVQRPLQGTPVRIGQLQRYATDAAENAGLWFHQPGSPTGKAVAVVGGGPAGLSCAHELRVLGHAVTVFEAREVAGGLNTLGLALYKITTEAALAEAERIARMGVEIRCGARVDAALLTQLREEYDAIFLAIGRGATLDLGIPGESSEGVWEALDFIFQTHRSPLAACEVGRRVVVIGGGNTAIDVATEAARLGAEQVTIAYRRRLNDMPAYGYELDLARLDRVQLAFLLQPVAFLAENGRLTGVRFQRLRMEGSGRAASLTPIPGATVDLPCDMAVKALGQRSLAASLGEIPGVQINGGQIRIDPCSRMTGAGGVFAGGDCLSNGAELVDAVQDGKLAARGIHAYLSEPDAHRRIRP